MNKQKIKIAETTLLMLNNKPWNLINLNEIYKKSKIEKNNMRGKILTKRELIRNIICFFDFRLKNSSEKIDISTHKDMIFEVMMSRFDILQDYRKSIIVIFDFLKNKPHEFVFLLPTFIKSVVLMANLSNISINGLIGNFKIKGLLVVYFSSFLVWTTDNTESLEKTMTSLDNNLDRAGKLFSLIK